MVTTQGWTAPAAKASGEPAKDRRESIASTLRLDTPGLATAEAPTSVLLINQYYWPDHASTAQHLTDLAEALAARGVKVTVAAGRGAYQKRAGDPSPRPPKREIRNGVEIRRVDATSLGRITVVGRMIDYLSFYVGAFFLCLRLKRRDITVTLTTPPLVGLIGALLRIFKKTKHVYWSMDLHPDASFALGGLSRRKPLGAILERLNAAVLKGADRVVVLGSYMADLALGKGTRAERTRIIPVWSRRDEVYPLPDRANPLKRELGLEGKLVLMYSGNLGLAHSFDEFIAAARALAGRPEIVFLFVGAGPRRREVERAKAEEGLANVVLLDYFPRGRLHESLSLADAHLISMRPEMTGIVVPGKLYGAMASGRPVIFVGPEHCETADAVREASCGWTVPRGDLQGLLEAIESIAADRSLADALGRNGRESFLEHYDAEVCLRSWLALVDELAAESRSGRRSSLRGRPSGVPAPNFDAVRKPGRALRKPLAR